MENNPNHQDRDDVEVVGIIEIIEVSAEHVHDHRHGHHHDHDDCDEDDTPAAVELTVRTPAGAAHDFTFTRNEKIHVVIRDAVAYFVAAGQLAAGNYGLALARDGKLIDLNDAGRLDDYDVQDCDTLFLTNKDPQVDG